MLTLSQLYDHLILPQQLHEPLAQSRRFLDRPNQRTADRVLRLVRHLLVVGDHHCGHLPSVGDLYGPDGLVPICDGVHDYLEHSEAVEVH